MGPAAWKVLIALEAFQVLFLLLHDWVPVPPLNDVTAQRETDPLPKRAVITLVSAAPFMVLLVQTLRLGSGRPATLLFWLWVAYGLLFLGELNAWWIPYGLAVGHGASRTVCAAVW